MGSHLVLLLVMLPVIGIGLVLASAGFAVESIRRTAVTNVWLTCLAAMLLAVYVGRPMPGSPPAQGRENKQALNPGDVSAQERVPWRRATPERVQLRSEFRWLGAAHGPDVRISVGVDGLSVWFLVITPLVMLPAVHAGRAVDGKRPALLYALLLASEASLLGLFAAQDVVLFCVLLQASTLTGGLLIGWWGGYDRRRIVLKATLLPLAGGLLVTAGLLAVVLVHARMRVTSSSPHPLLCFSVEALIAGGDGIPGVRQWLEAGSTSRRQMWDAAASWAFPLILLGLAVRVPLPPLHTWYTAAVSEAPTSAAITSVGTGLAVGSYGLLRFVVPLFPELVQAASDWLLAGALMGAVYAALAALAHGEMRTLASYACVSHACLCAAGIFSLNPLAGSGAVLQLLAAGASAGLLLAGGAHLQPHGSLTLPESAASQIETPSRCSETLPALEPNDLPSARTKTPAPQRGVLRDRRERSALAGLTAGALGLAGAPLLGGFSAMLLNVAGILQGRPHTGSNLAGALAAAFASLIVAAAILRLCVRMLLAPVEAPAATHSRPRKPAESWAAVLPAGSILLGMGLLPQVFLTHIEPAVAECLRAYSAAQPSGTASTSLLRHSGGARTARQSGRMGPAGANEVWAGASRESSAARRFSDPTTDPASSEPRHPLFVPPCVVPLRRAWDSPA